MPTVAVPGELTATVKVHSSTCITVLRPGVAVRDSAGNNYGFPGPVTSPLICPNGYTLTTGSRDFPAGTYTDFGFYRDAASCRNLSNAALAVASSRIWGNPAQGKLSPSLRSSTPDCLRCPLGGQYDQLLPLRQSQPDRLNRPALYLTDRRRSATATTRTSRSTPVDFRSRTAWPLGRRGDTAPVRPLARQGPDRLLRGSRHRVRHAPSRPWAASHAGTVTSPRFRPAVIHPD